MPRPCCRGAAALPLGVVGALGAGPARHGRGSMRQHRGDAQLLQLLPQRSPAGGAHGGEQCGEAQALPLVSPAPRGPGDNVLPHHPQDKDGQKQCVAHSALRGQGVYAIARCCTWPRAECHIQAGSPGAECPPGHHVLTGNTNTRGYTPLGLMDEGVTSRKTAGFGGKRVGVVAGVAGKGYMCCVHGGGRLRALSGHPWQQCVHWDAAMAALCHIPSPPGRL